MAIALGSTSAQGAVQAPQAVPPGMPLPSLALLAQQSPPRLCLLGGPALTYLCAGDDPPEVPMDQDEEEGPPPAEGGGSRLGDPAPPDPAHTWVIP